MDLGLERDLHWILADVPGEASVCRLTIVD